MSDPQTPSQKGNDPNEEKNQQTRLLRYHPTFG